MAKPEEYRHIAAWGKIMQSFAYYVRNEQRKAAAADAPIDAICRRGDGTWCTFNECRPETQQEILRYLD